MTDSNSELMDFYIIPWKTGSYDIVIHEDKSLWYTWVPEYDAFVFDDPYTKDNIFDHDFEHQPITIDHAIALIESKAKRWPVRFTHLYTEEPMRISYQEVLNYRDALQTKANREIASAS